MVVVVVCIKQPALVYTTKLQFDYAIAISRYRGRYPLIGHNAPPESSFGRAEVFESARLTKEPLREEVDQAFFFFVFLDLLPTIINRQKPHFTSWTVHLNGCTNVCN